MLSNEYIDLIKRLKSREEIYELLCQSAMDKDIHHTTHKELIIPQAKRQYIIIDARKLCKMLA